MYRIEYKKNIGLNAGIFKRIKSLTIDKEDVLMMQNIDIIHGGDKNLFALYIHYLMLCKENDCDYNEVTILNNSNYNQEIITSVILCNWLVNEKNYIYSKDDLQRKKEFFQQTIDVLKDSNKESDKKQCLLMQYFVDTIDKLNVKDEKIKIKKEGE